eukprot:TRINITY_DN11979_c0_g1_i1.p1 TRINITY_DN11979_c0_g1~~TRINITY_DN11979_c0_g1_i1.p1  ORF type:complete len:271 (-),score=29.50 TRINITY_DN11979_c0_g1_i1:174-986(-)
MDTNSIVVILLILQCGVGIVISSNIDMTQCSKPSGFECTFYPDCVERYIPCGNGTEGYAIPYGLKFCNRFSSSYDKFSTEGKRWIVATRLCLQKELIPIFYTNNKPTCSEIKHNAFESHVKCYTAPAPGVSVCNIASDWIHILRTIYRSYIEEPSESIQQTLSTIFSCGELGITEYILKPLIDLISKEKRHEMDSSDIINTQMNEYFRQTKQSRSALTYKLKTGEYKVVIFGETNITTETPHNVTKAIMGGYAIGSELPMSVKHCAGSLC